MKVQQDIDIGDNPEIDQNRKKKEGNQENLKEKSTNKDECGKKTNLQKSRINIKITRFGQKSETKLQRSTSLSRIRNKNQSRITLKTKKLHSRIETAPTTPPMKSFKTPKSEKDSKILMDSEEMFLKLPSPVDEEDEEIYLRDRLEDEGTDMDSMDSLRTATNILAKISSSLKASKSSIHNITLSSKLNKNTKKLKDYVSREYLKSLQKTRKKYV